MLWAATADEPAKCWSKFLPDPGLKSQKAILGVVCRELTTAENRPYPIAFYEGQCPDRGLRAFDVVDAPFFFGREALVQWLLNELRPATEGQPVNRFLAIVGASGSGKSSMARAGLIAVLSTMLSQAAPIGRSRSAGPNPIP